MFINSKNINKRISNLLKSLNFDYKTYDQEGNSSYDFEKIKYFYVEAENFIILLKEPNDPKEIKIFVSSFDDVKKRKEFFKRIKEIANYFNISYSLKNFGKKVEPKLFSSLNENTNKINNKNTDSYGDIDMTIEEGRRKKGVDFEVTPEIRKWAEFLQKLDSFTGGFPDRLGSSEEGEDVGEEELLRQAKRLVNREVKKFPGAKEVEPQTQFSKDKNVANAQRLHDFYSQVSQYLDPDKDYILGNIVSRVADHYLYLATGQTPTMSHGSSNFKAAEKLADEVAKMVGLKKPMMESSDRINAEVEQLFEWFKTFDVKNIFLDEKKQLLLKEKAILKQKINEAKRKLIEKRNRLIENKQKLYNLALSVGRNYKNDYKINELTKILSESQKEKVLNIVKETFNDKVFNKIKTLLK